MVLVCICISDAQIPQTYLNMRVFARDGHCSYLQLHKTHSLVYSFTHLLNSSSPGVEVYTVLTGCLYEFLFWHSAAAHNVHVHSV